MSRMSLDTAIRLSAEVRGGNAIDRVKRSLQDFGKTGQTSKRDLDLLRAATFQFSRANDQTIAGIRNSINAFRGLQEQARIGGREFKRYGEEIQRLEAKLSGLDGAATKAGASLGQKLAAGLAAAGVGRSLQGITMQAANFDAELRKAAAIEGGTGSFGVLRKEIEAVAAVAAGTPTEVAALATALSRAGFSADQTTKALRGIVLGAEATDTAFDQMGGIVGTILKTFQMDASQTAAVVDILVKSANSADQTVTDVGEAMAYAAGQASSLGVSVEDASALIALFADASVRGSRAGTALATGLNRLQIAAGGGDSELQELTRGSAKMSEAMSRLGASILDTEGKLRPLDEVMIAIKRQMDQFSATDRAIIAKALFGEESGRSFQAVLQRSEADIIKMFRATNQAGGTAEETRGKMRGFADSVKILNGNVQNLTNQIGDVINTALKPLIDALNGAIGFTQNWSVESRRAAATAAAAGLSVLGLVAAITALKVSLGVVTSISAASAALKIYTGAATGAGVASATAATKATMLLGVLTKLGKIGLIVIGVKFAIEGLDELITGLVGVRDADRMTRAMAERRGLSYRPSAAVQRRNTVRTGDLVANPASGATFTVAGIVYDSNGVPLATQPTAATPRADVLTGGGGSGGSGGSGGGSGGGRSGSGSGRSEREKATLTSLASGVGFSPQNARIMAAIALAESAGNPMAHNKKYPDNSYGLWQINMLGGMGPERRRQFGIQSNEQLFDPAVNARAAKSVFDSQGFGAWSVYRSGAYKQFLGKDAEVGGVDSMQIANAQIDAANDLRSRQEAATDSLEKFVEARIQGIAKLKEEGELLKVTTDTQRRQLEYAFEQSDIQERFKALEQEAIKRQEEMNALGLEYNLQEQQKLINNEKQAALTNARVKYEQEINDLMVERSRMMQDIVRQSSGETAFNPLEQQKADLDALLQKYPQVGAAADAAADLATRGFTDMATGARSAKEVFADFLRGIADALIQTAKTMIAQYIAIGVAKMFAGLGGGRGGGDFSPSSAGPFGGSGLSTGLSFDPSGFSPGPSFDASAFGRAMGGPVNPGEIRPVGERGPELFVPYQAGTIIPAEATEALAAINSAAQGRLMVPYMGGGSGAAVSGQRGTSGLSVPFQGNGQQGGGSGLSVPFLKGADGMDGAAGGGGLNDPIRFESVLIGEVEYVTRSEAEEIGRRSEQRGAQRGAALAEKRARNNVTTRRSYR
jgi:TP901 family phage tail tape measure protein